MHSMSLRDLAARLEVVWTSAVGSGLGTWKGRVCPESGTSSVNAKMWTEFESDSWYIDTVQQRDWDQYRDLTESIVPYGTVHTGPRQGKGPGTTVSNCANHVPCTIPVLAQCNVNKPSVLLISPIVTCPLIYGEGQTILVLTNSRLQSNEVWWWRSL